MHWNISHFCLMFVSSRFMVPQQFVIIFGFVLPAPVNQLYLVIVHLLEFLAVFVYCVVISYRLIYLRITSLSLDTFYGF